jgi:hypothetical protein
MINIRKLAAVDMVWLGTRIILAEYALGLVLPLILGLLSIRSGLSGWKAVLGIWLIAIAANYISLFIYAVLTARAGTVREEAQQVIILVPFLVVILALLQERQNKT